MYISRSKTFVLLLLLASSTLYLNAQLPGTSALRNGDLLFIAQSQGSFSRAISHATRRDSTPGFTHVAIIERQGSGTHVIEASTDVGVRRISWRRFINSLARENGQCSLVVKRVKAQIDIDKAVKRAKTHLKEPYDWWFQPNNGKMYCSELVAQTYLLDSGEPLFRAKPMNFLDARGELPEFFKSLFKRLNTNAPQGVPGTNPNDMSNDESLTEVLRWP